jgi:hypothetical protein
MTDTLTPTNNPTETNVAQLEAPKKTRTRKPAAPKPTGAPPAPPTRTLAELNGVAPEDMTREELLLVIHTVDGQNTQLYEEYQKIRREFESANTKLARMNAKFAYIKQTIEHARDSILLQMDPVGLE